MSFHWEIDLYFDQERREPEEDYETTRYYGRPAYKVTVEVDGFEHGSSGSLGLYREDEETGMMRQSESIKDDGLVGVNATRVGEPDTPDEETESDDEDWDQDAQ